MAETMIRGYSLQRTAAFIDTHFDPDTAARVKAPIAEALQVAATARPADWYPRKHSSEMFHAIASAKQDEKGSYEDLVACGTYVCAEAINTFFRVLLKIMTPTLFAKKLPTFWDRDQKGGRFEYDISRVEQNQIGLRLVDVADYPHIAPVTIGFVGFVLNTMGKRAYKVSQTGWSLSKPALRDIDFAVTWD